MNKDYDIYKYPCKHQFREGYKITCCRDGSVRSGKSCPCPHHTLTLIGRIKVYGIKGIFKK